MKTSVKRRAKNCIRGTVLLACFIAVWYVASCFTQPLFIPAPATVCEAIVGLAETGQLQKGLAYSFLRITGASALSMYEALLTKSMTVEFVADTAQFKNPEEAYAIMDEFVSIANTLDGAIIQVEGNINARNYSDSGQALSAERAKAVAKYFIACGIDPNRLITVGNGNTKMVADPGSADAYLNRRTDVFFKIIEE